MPKPKAIILLSGGLDSSTCAAVAREEGYALLALTVDYNQRHRVELEAARAAAEKYGAERHVVLPLDLSAFGGSSLTADIDVPKGDGAVDDSIVPPTYVPARNTVFLSVALAWAEAAGARDIFIGVNALDYSGYPDCRPDFIAAFEELAAKATRAGIEGDAFRIHTPLLDLDKAGIAKLANRLGVDAGATWTCYDPVPGKSEMLHCGRCDACRLRKKGFEEAALPDPTRYAA
ncbi:7-cyano-7-deazaguanine synthase QueC [Pacificimonas sp. ICDLI1SI03]